MIEGENKKEGGSLHKDELELSAEAYLKAAHRAVKQGEDELAMYLYLCAFEKESLGSYPPSEEMLAGLHAAWNIACERRERTMAEYLFEKLEPFLSTNEIPLFADRLQSLAFDKLAELGIPRDELQNIADALSQDFFGGAHPFMHIDQVGLPFGVMSERMSLQDGAHEGAFDDEMDESDFLRATFEPVADTSAANDDYAPTLADMIGEDVADAADAAGDAADGENASAERDGASAAAKARPPKLPARETEPSDDETLTFDDLAGYIDAVAQMRALGIGLKGDEDFQKFVALLNERHGTERTPSLDTLLLKSAAREDANRFAQAMLGELGLPVMRVTMEENFQGMPVLCLSTRADNHARFTSLKAGIKGPAVLVLEDVDAWTAPEFCEEDEECALNAFSNMTRGAHELLEFIRATVENPDVYVIVTAGNDCGIDRFFLEVLSPVFTIDIALPNEAERSEIWNEIARDHASIADVDVDDLVRLSAGMSRNDIYLAAREAVDEAYKASLAARKYVAVTPANVFEKLAGYHSLESQSYSELEDAVIDDFRRDLDHLEDLLGEGDL